MPEVPERNDLLFGERPRSLQLFGKRPCNFLGGRPEAGDCTYAEKEADETDNKEPGAPPPSLACGRDLLSGVGPGNF